MERPISVFRGRKSNIIIQTIIDVHFKDSTRFYDPTWGKGVFWQDFQGGEVIGSDIDPTRAKDFVADCRQTGLKDDAADVVVIDLPFMHAKVGDAGTNLFSDFRGIKNQKEFVETAVDAVVEAARISTTGCILKCKDTVEAGKFRMVHVDVINGVEERLGIRPVDMAVFVPDIVLANDPKWKTVQHFRVQHSYFLVYKWGRKS